MTVLSCAASSVLTSSGLPKWTHADVWHVGTFYHDTKTTFLMTLYSMEFGGFGT